MYRGMNRDPCIYCNKVTPNHYPWEHQDHCLPYLQLKELKNKTQNTTQEALARMDVNFQKVMEALSDLQEAIRKEKTKHKKE